MLLTQEWVPWLQVHFHSLKCIYINTWSENPSECYLLSSKRQRDKTSEPLAARYFSQQGILPRVGDHRRNEKCEYYWILCYTVYTCVCYNWWHLSLYWNLGSGWTEEALAAFPVHQPLPGQELFSGHAPKAHVEMHSRAPATVLSAEWLLRRGRHFYNAPAPASGGRMWRRWGAWSRRG